jgi:hypothetical protein
MAQPRDDRQKEVFRPALDQIIDMGHPLAGLAQNIDWDFLDRPLGGIYKPGAGHPTGEQRRQIIGCSCGRAHCFGGDGPILQTIFAPLALMEHH